MANENIDFAIKDLKTLIASEELQLTFLKGRSGIQGRLDAIKITEKTISEIQNNPNFETNDLLQAVVEDEQRILANNQAEVERLKGLVEEANAKKAELEAELANLTAQKQSNQSTKNSAQGQTAEASVNNNANPSISGAGATSAVPTSIPLNSAEVAKLERGLEAAEGAAQTFQVPVPGYRIIESNEKGDVTKAEIYDKTIYDNDKQKSLSNAPVAKYSNILHNFTGYTYRITLFLLTKSDYQQLSNNGPEYFEPKYALISSGGTYGGTRSNTTEVGINGGPRSTLYDTIRHPDFLEDFFIENLQLQTVVGLNAKTKSSNSIDISFNIVEPYGMTLLDRLLSACETTAECSNYIEQPYLLQIDFLSNPEEEVKPSGILIERKRLAIRFIEFKIKPGTGGTEYRVRAIPYNHIAFSQSNAKLPINLTVEASTVGEFFSSDDIANKAIGNSIEANQERIEQELEKWVNANFFEVPPTAAELDAKRAELNSGLTYNSTSLPAGFNEYMISISKKGKLFTFPQTLIGFKIDDTFKNSPLVSGDSTNVSSDPLVKPAITGIVAVTSGYVNPEYKVKQVFNNHAGSDIVTVIDRVMQASQYIKDQVLDARQAAEEAAKDPDNRNNPDGGKNFKYLNWYKIIPQVKLLDFDKSRNAYSKMIVFSVVPYKVANPYHPDFAKTKIDKNKISRTYEYLYTGRNQDIINVDIDFDLAFYAQLTTFQDNKRRSGTNYSSSDPFVNNLESRDSGTNRTQDVPIQFAAVGSEQQGSSALNRGKDSKDQAVASLVKSLYTSSRGDMLNIKVRIVGDPAYIKQDEVYFNPADEGYKQSIKNIDPDGPPIDPQTGQIFYDLEQVYVQFITKSAVDINDATGITNKQIILSNGRKTDSTFSGVYKVLKVSNEFVRGKFEQIIELIRMPNDFEEGENKTTSKSTTQSGTKLELITDTPTPSLPDNQLELPELPSSDLKSIGQSFPISVNQSSDAAQLTPRAQTFGEAFRQARQDFGNKPGGQFEWRGKNYQTNLANEAFVDNPKDVY